MRWLVAAAVLALLLAGCASDPKPQADASDPFAGITDDVEVTESRGAIAGVVVDPAIRPLGNVTVVLVGQDRNATTDDLGRFVFEGLRPGAYFMQASARRHESAQVSVDVVAGEPTAVRIMLVPSTSAEPYHMTLQFRGHIDMYLSEASFAAELVAPGTLQCTCAWNFTPDPGLQSIVFEASGTTSIPNPGTPATVDGDAYWELIEDDGNGAIHSKYDNFPFSHLFENGTFDEPQGTFLARITGGAWPSGTMDYDLYVTLWYHEAAPDGWSIFNGDT